MAKKVDIFCVVESCRCWVASDMMTSAEIDEFNREYRGVMVANIAG